mmetsp:Transcript_28071/g.72194  ORF Transcript_28071/g.72194 Transcript_28071/m.72194 type:complete len:278 (-) Transcript_28071:980-1813(-)
MGCDKAQPLKRKGAPPRTACQAHDRQAGGDLLPQPRALQGALAVSAVLGVRVVHVKQLGGVALGRRELHGGPRRPGDAAAEALKPGAEHHCHLVGWSRHDVPVHGADPLPLEPLGHNLLLMVKEDHVLVDEHGSQHVIHPLGHGRRELHKPVALHVTIGPCNHGLASKGPAVTRRSRDCKQADICLRLAIPVVTGDADVAWRLKLRRGTVHCADEARAHPVLEALLYIRLPLRMKLEIFWVVVAVAHDPVMTDRHMRRVGGILHEKVPPKGDIPDDP